MQEVTDIMEYILNMLIVIGITGGMIAINITVKYLCKRYMKRRKYNDDK